MANIYIKVSMHALASGVMCVFIAWVVFNESVNLSLYLAAAILITGIVCSSRLVVSDHTQREIYMGLLLGGAAQVVALIVS
jgi:drug/metabolite transporter (DMT)-like permease